MTSLEAAEETIAFGRLSIAFDERVLRPRPWTVGQSEWAAQLLYDVPGGPVLELCTGAGQIGLLAVADADRRLVCVDADPVACDYARRNAAAAGMADRVEVREGRMDEVLTDDERFALVVADPPWVPSAQVSRYPEDPTTAIDGGGDGLDVARTCVAVGLRHLMPGGSLLLQLGTVDQATSIADEAGVAVNGIRTFERGVVVRLDP